MLPSTESTLVTFCSMGSADPPAAGVHAGVETERALAMGGSGANGRASGSLGQARLREDCLARGATRPAEDRAR